ncbi:MAG: hypothetical protein HXS44_07300 [Theionarchaea archaeon]|nr:hypothetical protein [Theionarchaea archaeon]
MKLLQKAYYNRRRVKLFWAVITVALTATFVLQRFIPKISEMNPLFIAIFNYSIGTFETLSFLALHRAAYKPKMRMCEHFLLCDYDLSVWDWSQIENIRVDGTKLTARVMVKNMKVTSKVSLSNVINTEDLIRDIENICAAKGIPFERILRD